jgi:hypothetical protein
MIAVVEKYLAKSLACRKPGKLRQVNIGSEPRQDFEPGPNVLNRTLLSTVTDANAAGKKWWCVRFLPDSPTKRNAASIIGAVFFSWSPDGEREERDNVDQWIQR